MAMDAFYVNNRSKSKERITLGDTTLSAMARLAEGNPGGLTVCIRLVQYGPQLDPDNVMGGLGMLLSLDTLGIYGSHIWILYKDICGESLLRTAAILRGCQLGIIRKEDVHAAIQQAEGRRVQSLTVIDFDSRSVLAAVQECLPNFAKTEADYN